MIHPVQEIRRYSNRKLYCATESKHITLPEIGDRFLRGQGFCIRDARTREDVTVKYLVKALVSTGYFDKEVDFRNRDQCFKNLKESLPKELNNG